MSKAFTKEDSPAIEAEDGDDEGVPLPKGARNYITPQGAARMREELRELLHEKRPEVVRTVSWAASNGDRSENGDYIYGKRRLREIDRRVRFLTKRLDIAEVVDPVAGAARQRSGGMEVLFGATVSVRDDEGQVKTYAIVGIDETDLPRGRVSWISPVGRALLNAKCGDVVIVRTPRGGADGNAELEVIKIEYVALD